MASRLVGALVVVGILVGGSILTVWLVTLLGSHSPFHLLRHPQASRGLPAHLTPMTLDREETGERCRLSLFLAVGSLGVLLFTIPMPWYHGMPSWVCRTSPPTTSALGGGASSAPHRGVRHCRESCAYHLGARTTAGIARE